jgi:hypothetical protein
MTHARKPVEPWDTDKAAQLAADALHYLGRNAPEVLENTSVLEPHEEAAHQAAMRGAMRSLTWRLSELTAGPGDTRPCGFVGVRRERRIDLPNGPPDRVGLGGGGASRG